MREIDYHDYHQIVADNFNAASAQVMQKLKRHDVSRMIVELLPIFASADQSHTNLQYKRHEWENQKLPPLVRRSGIVVFLVSKLPRISGIFNAKAYQVAGSKVIAVLHRIEILLRHKLLAWINDIQSIRNRTGV